MKKRIEPSDIAFGLLVLCALVTTAFVVRRELRPPELPEPELVEIPNRQVFATTGHRAGPTGAPVTITVFSDFQCPFCRVHAARLDTLRAEFGDQLAVVYRHFPLANHPFALEAVRASECAGRQGRFWQYRDALFVGQDSIGISRWERFAREAGVANLDDFAACMSETTVIPSLRRDSLDASRLRLVATPTSLVNGRLIRGAMPLDVLRDAVRAALRR